MIAYDFQQYSPEWFKRRCGVPTASELHRILTPKKCEFAAGAETYALELLAQRYDYNYGNCESYVSAAMRNGTIMEPEARRYYELQRNTDVQQVGFITSDDGFWGASPDSLCGEDGGLELKNPTAATHIKWLLAGQLPPEHRAQVHSSMVIAKRPWWDFLSYYPNLPPLLIRVEPDDYTLKLAEAMTQFRKMYEDLAAKLDAISNEQGDPVAATREPVESYF